MGPCSMTTVSLPGIFASGHVVHHEPTCRPGTKMKYGGGGESKKGKIYPIGSEVWRGWGAGKIYRIDDSCE